MDLKEVKRLRAMVEEANVSHFSIESEGTKIEIKKEIEKISASVAPTVSSHIITQPLQDPQPSQPIADAAPASSSPSPDSDLVAIKSIMVGTFYSSPNPESAAYVKVGDSVDVGQVVCIVEAMKLFNEIESDVSGTIEKICVKDGDSVEYGQDLFLVKKT